jgi:hypothetical protein
VISWIEQLQRETDNAETPRQYIYWAGLSIISAIISPNTYLNLDGVLKMRPNTYILLIGKSGLGKGLPNYLAKKLVEETKATRVISGRNTIQSVVQELSRIKSTPEGPPTFTDSRGYLQSGEFHNLMQQDPHALTILTEWYDAHYVPDWKNTTKTGGGEVLRYPCISLFGGSSPEHFNEAVPLVNISGGFVGRTLLVYADRRHKYNSLVGDSNKEVDIKSLSNYLHQLAKLKGKFKWTKEGADEFTKWYDDFRPRSEKMQDKTNTIERMPDHIRKVSMLISASKSLSLEISKDDVDEAINECIKLGNTARRITHGGKNSLAEQTKKVLIYLLEADTKSVSRSILLRKGFGDYDAVELDKIVDTLHQTGFVDIKGGKETIYTITERGINLWAKLEQA